MAKKIGTAKVKRLFLGTDSGGRGTEVTSSAAELNIMDGVTATATELNLMDGVTATTNELNMVDNMWASVATVFVDGTDGTGTLQFTFSDAAGATMATQVAGMLYVTDDEVNSYTVDTSFLTLTNGELQLMDAQTQNGWRFITSAAGLLGGTITITTGEYWVAFIHPTGKIVLSSAFTVTNV